MKQAYAGLWFMVQRATCFRFVLESLSTAFKRSERLAALGRIDCGVLRSSCARSNTLTCMHACMHTRTYPGLLPPFQHPLVLGERASPLAQIPGRNALLICQTTTGLHASLAHLSLSLTPPPKHPPDHLHTRPHRVPRYLQLWGGGPPRTRRFRPGPGRRMRSGRPSAAGPRGASCSRGPRWGPATGGARRQERPDGGRLLASEGGCHWDLGDKSGTTCLTWDTRL